MKNYITHIGILIIGLILGWLIFSNSTKSEQNHNHETDKTSNINWTCSMHPQIMQPEAGDCPICGMDLIPAETSTEGLAANEFKMSENALALANIETTIINAETITSNNIVLSGKIKENEKTNAIQTAHFGGRIEKLYINSNGEQVTKGQLLALIYSPELVTAQKELLTALEMKTLQPNLYNAVKNKLKLWKLSENQIQKIESTKKVIPNFPVYANVSGVVTNKMVEEGNYIKEGSPLLKIANLTTVWAEFDVYEKQISSIKNNDKITISTNANPTIKISSEISFINPVLNTLTRTIVVRAELDNSKNDLKPGMFIQGSLKSETTKNNVISIPKTAVLWTGKRSIIYVKKQGVEPIFEMRNVTLGNEIGDSYELLAGLNINEEIVTNGTFTIDAAAQLQGKKSMMNKIGGKVITGHESHIDSQKTTELLETALEIKKIQVPSKFKEQLKHVFQGYLAMKDALVNDDSSLTQKSTATIIEQLNKVDMKLLPDADSHNKWMFQLKNLNKALKEIANSNDIKTQREQFILLSNNITQSIETFGVNQKIYKQHCPMANNDKGAIWLSTEKEIMNPYFGASMLKCGTIEAILE